jgi:CRISPR/Cas system-associated endonuclease/helicase Cas3
MEVVNQIQGSYVASDLVYPLDKGYYYIAKLDEQWLKEKLHHQFNNSVHDIHNKTVVSLEVNNGGHILVVNHDGEYWIIAKPI